MAERITFDPTQATYQWELRTAMIAPPGIVHRTPAEINTTRSPEQWTLPPAADITVSPGGLQEAVRAGLVKINAQTLRAMFQGETPADAIAQSQGSAAVKSVHAGAARAREPGLPAETFQAVAARFADPSTAQQNALLTQRVRAEGILNVIQDIYG